MSDNRDEATGQFANAEPEYGLRGVEQDSGYVHLPEEEKQEPEGLTVAEAAERFNSRMAQGNIATYGPVDRLPENLALTVEQAAKIKADRDSADVAQAELDADEKLRKEVDELRGVKPDAEEAKAAAEKAEAPLGKDPQADVERFLALPHVKEAVDKLTTETESVRRAYSQGVDIANEFARASFVENFPEIAGLPLPQWEGALAAMAQREPERFGRAVNTLQRVVQLQTAQQHQQAQRAEAERVRLQGESKRFEDKIKDVPKARRDEVESEIVEALKERGANMKEVVTFLRSSEASSATVMELLWELGDLRSKMKAIRTAPAKAIPKPVPKVQRPGVGGAIANRDAASYAALSERLSKSGSTEDAFKLYQARKRGRG